MIPVELGTVAFAVVFLAGVLMGWLSISATKNFTDWPRLTAAANRVVGHLFEFRLFAQEPILLFRAQRRLVVANAGVIVLLVKPLAIMAIPSAALFLLFDGLFAKAPLPLNKPAVVTAQFPSGPLLATLTSPPEVRIDGDPVHAFVSREISWRLLPVAAVSKDMRMLWNGRLITKRIVAGQPYRWTFDSALIFFGPSIQIQYPPALIFGVSWIWWFCAGLVVATAVRFGVERFDD